MEGLWPGGRKLDGDLDRTEQVHRHQIVLSLEGHGEDSELYPKSGGKVLNDSEQRSAPTGVC